MNVYDIKVEAKQRALFILQGLSHLLLTVFVISVIWLMAVNRNWNTLATWHVFLCTIGVSLLMAEGITMLNQDHLFLIGVSRKVRKSLHLAVMMLSGFVVISGVGIKILDKINNSRDHFTSPHGICGFITFLLTILAIIGGIIVNVATRLYKKIDIKPVYVKSFHSILGIITYVMGTVTLWLGLRQYFQEASSETNTGFIVILVICAGLNLGQPIKRLIKL